MMSRAVPDTEPAEAQPRIVGRADELATIGAAISAVVRGGVCRLALVGEPGIGKTIVLDEACRRGAVADMAVLRGQGTEFERNVPFALLMDALDEPFSQREG